MISAATPSPRPRRAIEDPDAFLAETAPPARAQRGRLVRIGIAVSAVATVGVLATVVPGIAQEVSATTEPTLPVATRTAAAGSVESFATRGTSTDRDTVREQLTAPSVADAAQARSVALTTQGQAVASTQQQAAVSNRAAGLNTTTTAIKAESERLLAKGNFFWPTAGSIGSPWGMRLHPILHYTRLHAGVDMGGSCDQPIWAAADGTVTEAGYSGGGGGNQTRIDHGTLNGEKIETAYLHQNKIIVKVGQKVTRGQVIGYVGSTGLSTSCHLHFSVYTNGNNVDPEPFLKA